MQMDMSSTKKVEFKLYAYPDLGDKGEKGVMDDAKISVLGS